MTKITMKVLHPPFYDSCKFICDLKLTNISKLIFSVQLQQVPEMSCGHCKAAIEKEVGKIECVTSVVADHETKDVVVKPCFRDISMAIVREPNTHVFSG